MGDNFKNQVIADILSKEGGYVNDPSDSGGETNYGITAAVAKSNGYKDSIRDMPKQVAFNIYENIYWCSVSASAVSALSELVAGELVDTAVNMGPKRGGIILQRCLNVLNDQGRLYPDVTVDGKIGPATLSSLGSYLAHRSEGVMVRAMNCLQGAFYIELAERREKDERFIYGWLKNRINLHGGVFE